MQHTSRKPDIFAFINGRPVLVRDSSPMEVGVDAAGARVEIPAHIIHLIIDAEVMDPARIQEICDGRGMETIKAFLEIKDRWAVRAAPGSAALNLKGMLRMLDQAPSMTQPEADFLSLMMLLFARTGVVTCEGRDSSIVPDPVAAAGFVFPTIRAIAAKASEARIMESMVRDGLLSMISEEGKPLRERKYSSLARHLCVQNAMRPDSPGPRDGDEEELLRACVEQQCAEDDPEVIEYKAEAVMDGHGIFKKDLREAESLFKRLIAASQDLRISARFYWRLSRLYSMRGMKDDAKSWECLAAAVAGRDGFALCDFAKRFGDDPAAASQSDFCFDAIERALNDGAEEYADGRCDNNLAGAAYLRSKDLEGRAQDSGDKPVWKQAFGYALLSAWALRLRCENSPSPEDRHLDALVMKQMLLCREHAGLVLRQGQVAINADQLGILLNIALSSISGRAMTATFIQKAPDSGWLCIRWEKLEGEDSAPAIITFCPEAWYAGAKPVILLEAATGRLVSSVSDEDPVVEFDEVRGTGLFLRGIRTGEVEGEFMISNMPADEWLCPGGEDEGDGGGDGGDGGDGDQGSGDDDAGPAPDDDGPFSMPSGDMLQ